VAVTCAGDDAAGGHRRVTVGSLWAPALEVSRQIIAVAEARIAYRRVGALVDICIRQLESGNKH
jgi:hypothetical protein